MSYALKSGDGRRIALGANVMTLKADAAQTGGAFTIAHYTVPAGFPGPELHTHSSFDETFYVLSGELEVVIGDRVETLAPGDFAYVRGSDPHTFANSTEADADVLLTCTPGGFEKYFEELASHGVLPDEATRSAIAAKYGVTAAG